MLTEQAMWRASPSLLLWKFCDNGSQPRRSKSTFLSAQPFVAAGYFVRLVAGAVRFYGQGTQLRHVNPTAGRFNVGICCLDLRPVLDARGHRATVAIEEEHHLCAGLACGKPQTMGLSNSRAILARDSICVVAVTAFLFG